MAEIKIEKEKPVRPWILGIIIAIVLLALLYFFVFKEQNDDFDSSDQSNTEQIDTIDSTTYVGEETAGWEDNQVNDSLTGGSAELTSAYLTSVEDESKLGADAAYTNNALVKLIDAVRAKATESQLNLDTDLKQVKGNEIKTSGDSTNASSEQIKETGNKIVAAMQNIQKEKYPQLTEDVNEMKNGVNHIDAKKKMDDQQKQIEAFFNKSSEVLKQMN